MPRNKVPRNHTIIRDRRDGYKLWAIARMRGVSVDHVAGVLVKSGLISIDLVEAVLARERSARESGITSSERWSDENQETENPKNREERVYGKDNRRKSKTKSKTKSKRQKDVAK